MIENSEYTKLKEDFKYIVENLDKWCNEYNLQAALRFRKAMRELKAKCTDITRINVTECNTYKDHKKAQQ